MNLMSLCPIASRSFNLTVLPLIFYDPFSFLVASATLSMQDLIRKFFNVWCLYDCYEE